MAQESMNFYIGPRTCKVAYQNRNYLTMQFTELEKGPVSGSVMIGTS
jgi:hypothetical protein